MDTAGRGDRAPRVGEIVAEEKERLQRYAATEYAMYNDDIVCSKDDFYELSLYSMEDP